MLKAEEIMTVRDVCVLVAGIFIWVVKFFPNVPEKGAVMEVLLREDMFVIIEMLSSRSLRAMLSVEFRSSELAFVVVLFLFKSTHVSRVSSDPMTSVVCRKFLKLKVKNK